MILIERVYLINSDNLFSLPFVTCSSESVLSVRDLSSSSGLFDFILFKFYSQVSFLVKLFQCTEAREEGKVERAIVFVGWMQNHSNGDSSK